MNDLDEAKMYFLQDVSFNIVIIENFDVRYKDLFVNLNFINNEPFG